MHKLEQDSITFGKYKGSTLSRVLRDRKYCAWLLEEDWFKTNYEFLYNRIKEYNPRSYFISPVVEEKNFRVSCFETKKLYLIFNRTHKYQICYLNIFKCNIFGVIKIFVAKLFF